MDERRVADYFVVAGLPAQDEDVKSSTNDKNNENEENGEILEDWCQEGTHLKDTNLQAPITDLAIIFPALGETCPEGYSLLEFTVSGFKADLNHGSLRTEECFLCFRRGRDKPPLVDIGVIYDGKERIMKDAEIVMKTPTGHIANVNNSTSRIFVTYRRASKKMPCNSLVVTDVCVILTNKGEAPPHAFCVIGKNLNKGMLGSDVYLCYKKSMNRANLISFKPAILYKYPTADYDSFGFPNSVAMFCLPMGATIECWPKSASKPKPVFSTFVLTVADAAQKIYGSAITFYEEVIPPENSISDNEIIIENTEVLENETEVTTEPSEIITSKPQPKKKSFKKFGILKKLNDLQLEKLQFTDPSTQSLNISKSICILSHWPFFDTFERFLVFLHGLVNRQPQNVPIEKYISYFLCDVPFPSPQRPRIFIQLSLQDRLILTQPEDLALPRSGASFRQLLINLGADNCMLILLLILTEQKILVHSLRPDVLTSVSEAIAMILFPFKWQCPYIPLCPLGLAEVLHAPLPFLIGVDSRFFDLYDPPSDVNCVNLDTNNIAICDDKKHLNNKLLPKKAARMLKNSLEKLHSKLITINKDHLQERSNTVEDKDFSVDKEFQQKRREQTLELEIQDAFLRFMALILKGYRSYLLPITKAPTVGTTDPTSLFNIQAFLRSRDKNHAKFYSMVVRTQMFIRFIEERSFVSDMDMAGLAFFDECTERVEEENGTMLLELDESQHSERTVFIPPPEPDPNQPPIIYETFKLDSKLMRPQKNFHLKNVAFSMAPGIAPGSPMARRTKHEIKVAQRMARKQAALPERWGRCLLNTCYSLWFLHLPAMLQVSSQPANILHQAYELLVKMQKLRLDPMEEVCYRAMMQLCGVYGQPVLAVKLLFHMKRSGVQPNALTYGFYNKAVLEATWPSDMTNSSQLMWNKLRNVIVGAALFKKAGKKSARRRLSVNNDALLSVDDIKGQNMEHAISRSSLDSTHSQDTEAAHSDSLKGSSIPDLPTFGFNELKKHLPRQNSIVKDTALLSNSQPEALDRSPSEPRLARSGESPVKSPVRTPVTENDPLGALANDDTPIVSPCEENDSNCSTSTLTVLNNTVDDSRPGGPLLFRNNILPRSATFHQAAEEASNTNVGHLQRSETMPHSVQQAEQERERDRLELGSLWSQNKDSVTSSLSSIGSSLKLSFGRYSTGGLAFAKNKDLISTNQLIESLSLSSYISPSGLTGKKSNEIILGGLNSLKSAATTVAKKFDEIKEAISATSTPVKSKERDQRLAYGISHESLDSLTDGSQQDRNELSARVAGEASVDMGSLYELSECLYPKGSRELEERVAVELVLSSASRCHNCSAILYDEEIMAGWQPEDSNLNTTCQFCDKATVPLLTVTILDYRCEDDENNHDPLMAGLLQEPRELPEPITVPYLNPLVLRKELENVLSQEGDSCLTKHKFIQEHPIVYWNLIWYFERINLTSHLPELWLNNCERKAEQPLSSTCPSVGVRTLWDNDKLHMERLPMYIQWKNNIEDRSFMQSVITYVRRNDLAEPIKRVALERNRNRNSEPTPFSIYRDILFLAFIVLGRGNIDQGAFDREYALSLEKLTEGEESLLCTIDAAPSPMTLYCRHYFKQLNV